MKCRCNCGYSCGGPGKCELDPLDCLEAGHWLSDCGHSWDGPVVDIGDRVRCVTCSRCGMLVTAHDRIAGF